MYSTKEGRENGEPWSKRAIEKNLPTALRPGADKMTGRQYIELWTKKVEGGEGYGTLFPKRFPSLQGITEDGNKRASDWYSEPWQSIREEDWHNPDKWLRRE
jgi:hypothetical protein